MKMARFGSLKFQYFWHWKSVESINDHPSYYTCSVCRTVHVNTVILSCEHCHTLCPYCVRRYLKGKSPQFCPVDNHLLKSPVENGTTTRRLEQNEEMEEGEYRWADAGEYSNHSEDSLDYKDDSYGHRFVDCFSCGRSLPKSQLVDHKRKCDRHVITCFWCQEKIKRVDLKEHMINAGHWKMRRTRASSGNFRSRTSTRERCKESNWEDLEKELSDIRTDVEDMLKSFSTISDLSVEAARFSRRLDDLKCEITRVTLEEDTKAKLSKAISCPNLLSDMLFDDMQLPKNLVSRKKSRDQRHEILWNIHPKEFESGQAFRHIKFIIDKMKMCVQCNASKRGKRNTQLRAVMLVYKKHYDSAMDWLADKNITLCIKKGTQNGGCFRKVTLPVCYMVHEEKRAAVVDSNMFYKVTTCQAIASLSELFTLVENIGCDIQMSLVIDSV